MLASTLMSECTMTLQAVKGTSTHTCWLQQHCMRGCERAEGMSICRMQHEAIFPTSMHVPRKGWHMLWIAAWHM